jgi:hypothetical protein
VRRPKIARMMGRAAGIMVAPHRRVRALFLAWLTLALILLALGRLSRAGEELAIAGFVTASEQDASQGYFAVGGDTMVVVKEGSSLQRWLKLHTGQRVRVTLEPAGPETSDRIR